MCSTQPTPRIKVTITLSRLSHSFSRDDLPPLVTLKITSSPENPSVITLYTQDSPLFLPQGLTTRGFTLFNLSSQSFIETATFRINRAPLDRIKGSPDNKFFLTLSPGEEISISAPFGRGGGVNKIRPQPKAIAEKGWELNDDGTERKTRRPNQPIGVDGLEPGVRYKIGLNEEKLKEIWWAPVPKEDILVEKDQREIGYVQDYEGWVKGGLEFEVEWTEVLVEK
ncbi:hypothetical protein QBC35DRAFT_27803 [Podospora australis]|uniref:Uncharacterized protein n=1 Tax=Podospora australis TaxID=1536484 RepID=A0AAN6X137_9PEZI|nr:hypothetical protein QBC35DRAFT_27803 [Podospora australis]